jgi:hypothetical protein
MSEIGEGTNKDGKGEGDEDLNLRGSVKTMTSAVGRTYRNRGLDLRSSFGGNDSGDTLEHGNGGGMI